MGVDDFESELIVGDELPVIRQLNKLAILPGWFLQHSNLRSELMLSLGKWIKKVTDQRYSVE